uniref:Vef-2 n=1 Tax=Cyclophragma undans nucleopolyhedrovirus TaxID=1906244 RepID=A0A288QW20_9ABAC
MQLNLLILPTRVPAWLSVDDNACGLHHGRVHLGCVCDGGTTIRVKLNNASEVPRVLLRCLNTGSTTETSVVVDANSSDQQINFDQLYVPFIDRPLNGMVADVTVTIESFVHTLPVYEHDTTTAAAVAESDFKTAWRDSDSPFALVNLGVIVFLVPESDKATIMSTDLLQLQQYYSSVFEFYNNTIQVSQLALEPAHRIFGVQFFCKADASGAGVAYYGKYWMGFSDSTLGSYIRPHADGWLSLHEIGHGYEFQFINNVPDLGEVWTNILPNLYQLYTMNALQRQTDAWVYDYGNRAAVERELTRLVDARLNYIDNAWNFRSRLLPFAFMTQDAHGKRAFQLMHNQFRAFRVYDDTVPRHYYIVDWWSNASPAADFLPLFMLTQNMVISKQMTGTRVSEMYTFERALGELKRVPYPACRLLNAFDTVTNNYGVHGLESNYSLIYPGQAVARNPRFIVNLVVDDLSQLLGDTFEVYDGSVLAFRRQVVEARVVITALPVGVYTVHAPRGKTRRYSLAIPDNDFNDRGNECTNLYLIVTDDVTHVDLMYTPIEEPRIKRHRVGYVLGFGDAFSAKFVVDIANRKIELIVYRRRIHSFFDKYFTIKVFRNDILVDELVVRGLHTHSFYQSAAYEPNDLMTLTFYDNLPRNRIIFMGTHLQLLQSNYRLTANSVVDQNNQNLKINTIEALESHIQFLDSHQRLLNIDNVIKDDVYLMIKSLPDSEKLLVKYCKYLPNYLKCRSPPPVTGPPLHMQLIVFIVLVCTLILVMLTSIILIVARGDNRQRTHAAAVAVN